MATPGQALDEFRGLIGVTERPLGSNNAPPVTDWSGMQDRWCAMACSYVLSRVGIPLRIWLCQSIMDMARASQGGWSWTTTEPQPGDLVLYQWDTGRSDHIGMVESVRPDAIVAIEGNYRDSCARVVRKRGASILGYARPPYRGQASASTSTSPGVPDFPAPPARAIGATPCARSSSASLTGVGSSTSPASSGRTPPGSCAPSRRRRR